jgi:hypothetical protein
MNRSINNFAAAIDEHDFMYAIGGETFSTRGEVERIKLWEGPALRIVPIAGGPDQGPSFTYVVQPDGVTLKAKENGEVLTNLVWYRISPAYRFPVVPFTLDVCTLRGDADGNGIVLAQDYFPVKNHLFEVTDCARYDLDGNGQVLANDYFAVKNHLFQCKPPKP